MKHDDEAVKALRQIKDRIGDLQKLKDQALGEGRKWTLDAIWNIAHNALINIDRNQNETSR